jgi:hypothetical protein
MPDQSITTDFAEGFRAGFEAARLEIERAAYDAVTHHRSVMKAIRSVKVTNPTREGS